MANYHPEICTSKEIYGGAASVVSERWARVSLVNLIYMKFHTVSQSYNYRKIAASV